MTLFLKMVVSYIEAYLYAFIYGTPPTNVTKVSFRYFKVSYAIFGVGPIRASMPRASYSTDSAFSVFSCIFILELGL